MSVDVSLRYILISVSTVTRMANNMEILVNVIHKLHRNEDDEPKKVLVTLSSSSTVLDLKQQIQKKEGVVPWQQQLVYQGKYLCDKGTLSDLGVQDHSIINLVVQVRGGGSATFQKLHK